MSKLKYMSTILIHVLVVLNPLLRHTLPHTAAAVQCSNPINTGQSWGHSCQGSADIGQGRVEKCTSTGLVRKF